MNCHSANSLAKRNKVMSPEQFNQVVEAITEGRYSWACVLILRFAGYNPVYFIPYRTYSRLVNENQYLKKASEQRQPAGFSTVSIGDLSTLQSLNPEKNLTSLETVAQSEANLYGGTFGS
ncbi:HetP family heterocyst commitment protein [Leptodesmis sp.]|uniref:HetP family heterocyst commitment protein n=1 Tax=Leptodesmis sp. TaxID=3100501 RepID=UPI0040535AD2